MRIKTILIIAAATLVGACNSGQKNVVSPEDFSKQLKNKASAVVLDVRSPEEFAMGYIEGARNINVNAPDFSNQVASIDKNSTVYVYCKSGSRSAKASGILKDLGYSNVVDLDGGILAWERQGFEVKGKRVPPQTSYTMASFNKEVQSSNLILVDFYADWCGPCKRMAPHIETMKRKYGDNLKVLKVDTDRSPEVSKIFEIRSIPLVKVYKDGKEVYDRMGYHSEEELDAVLQDYL